MVTLPFLVIVLVAALVTLIQKTKISWHGHARPLPAILRPPS
ncbi:MAG: hypothetical protein ACLVJH_12570 [Faecalibacterium prausnitzii]